MDPDLDVVGVGFTCVGFSGETTCFDETDDGFGAVDAFFIAIFAACFSIHHLNKSAKFPTISAAMQSGFLVMSDMVLAILVADFFYQTVKLVFEVTSHTV